MLSWMKRKGKEETNAKKTHPAVYVDLVTM